MHNGQTYYTCHTKYKPWTIDIRMEGYQGFSSILLAGTGYNELHYCKVTSSVMCGAKYKSVPGWMRASGLGFGKKSQVARHISP